MHCENTEPSTPGNNILFRIKRDFMPLPCAASCARVSAAVALFSHGIILRPVIPSDRNGRRVAPNIYSHFEHINIKLLISESENMPLRFGRFFFCSQMSVSGHMGNFKRVTKMGRRPRSG
jgi:hypothetical protein